MFYLLAVLSMGAPKATPHRQNSEKRPHSYQVREVGFIGPDGPGDVRGVHPRDVPGVREGH